MADSPRNDGGLKIVDKRWWAQEDRPAAAEPEPGTWQPGKPTYVEDLERRLAEKDRELAEYVAKYRGAAKEFDEARARLRKDIAKEIERGRRSMLAELVEVVDNLDRAIEAGRASGAGESLLQGVELVRRQFLGKLEGFGVTREEPLGERFDPARHEAVTTVPVAEPARDELICGVVQPGYNVAGEVLRPARVAVGRVTS